MKRDDDIEALRALLEKCRGMKGYEKRMDAIRARIAVLEAQNV